MFLRVLAFIVALPAAAAVTPQEVVADVIFTSPSGNIRCMLPVSVGEDVRCDLGVARQSYTNRPADCDGAWGMSFAVGPTGAGRLICARETFTAADERVLPYGAVLSFGGVTCRSEETGMTCVNDAGGGFSLARARQRVF